MKNTYILRTLRTLNKHIIIKCVQCTTLNVGNIEYCKVQYLRL